MGSGTPSHSGDNEHKGIAGGGRPGPAPKTKDSRSGRMGASEGTNPCTRPSCATKNVFDVLQDLSESIRGSLGPQLVKPDRMVRSRGRSGMGSNIAWHRRHNDSVD